MSQKFSSCDKYIYFLHVTDKKGHYQQRTCIGTRYQWLLMIKCSYCTWSANNGVDASLIVHHPLWPSFLTLSKKTSLLVNLRTAVRVSCTIPMTGLLDWGVTIIRGTMASSWISALVSRDWGRWRFISSPSKSALYGVVTLGEGERHGCLDVVQLFHISGWMIQRH